MVDTKGIRDIKLYWKSCIKYVSFFLKGMGSPFSISKQLSSVQEELKIVNFLLTSSVSEFYL